ncbi:MAG: S49 family peptidase [Calditrichia bacterium]
MPSWNELISEFNQQPVEYLRTKLQSSLQKISNLRGGRNVLFYASSFLQKNEIPPYLTQITHEDINGVMSTIHQMGFTKGLTLVLHTPGGITNAAESLVEYMHTKFDYIEVIVPTYAMSAGTMISLASNLIIMGKQSQLGPIDPQMPVAGRYVSAQSIVDQFEMAKKEISEAPSLANVWFPILQTVGPALLKEALNALEYSEKIVGEWLAKRMFSSDPDRENKSKAVAHFFRDAAVHLSHGSRISKERARETGVKVEDLENDQELQDAVLTAYHLMTIAFEKSPAAKVIESSHDRRWIKNYLGPQVNR